MSRKNRYRNRKPASRPSVDSHSVDPAMQTKTLAGVDGYANAAAFLGNESVLMASGTFLRSGVTSDPQLLTTTYREFWLATRIIDTPAEDMTRVWYSLTADFDKDDLADLRKLEARHNVRQELTDAIRWARLYGGSLALMIIRGEADKLDQPLDLDRLPPDCFQGLQVLDRAQGISPSLELVSDLDDPDFGLPMYYTVDLGSEEFGPMKMHHSRVLRFVSRELPRMEMIAEDYFGASELEHTWDELQKRSATSANIAQLVFQANVTTLKMGNLGDSIALGSEESIRAARTLVSEENRLRTSFGLQLLSKEDSYENHPYSFAGLPDIYELFMMDVAGAAEIPATKLFGRSPAGMNATGEADMRNYYEMISGLQERMLRPALERLLPVMVISCWGYLPDDLSFVFNPLSTESPDHIADLSQKLSTPVIEAYKAGLITRESAVEELKARGEAYALWSKVEPASDATSQVNADR